MPNLLNNNKLKKKPAKKSPATEPTKKPAKKPAKKPDTTLNKHKIFSFGSY